MFLRLIPCAIIACLLTLLSACSIPIQDKLEQHLQSCAVTNPHLQKSAQALVHLQQGDHAFNGTLVSASGLVLSVSHGLMNDERPIKARLMNGQLTQAKILYSNPQFDLAVLQLADYSGGFYLPLASQIQEGMPVIALGRHRLPDSLRFCSGTIKTAWINLANMEVSNLKMENIAVQNAIFHSAPTQQGFSGGPLINLKGELMAINNAILDTKGASLSISLNIENFTALLAAIENGTDKPVFPKLESLEQRLDFLLAGLTRHGRHNNIDSNTLELISFKIKQTALKLSNSGDMSEQQLNNWVWKGFIDNVNTTINKATEKNPSVNSLSNTWII